jgi:hypothetical protein
LHIVVVLYDLAHFCEPGLPRHSDQLFWQRGNELKPHQKTRMIAYIALGFAVFAAAIIMFVLYSGYMKKRELDLEAFQNESQVNLDKEKAYPGGVNDRSGLSPEAVNAPGRLIESAGLPGMSTSESLSNLGKMTSERCFRADIGESLKKTRNYLQRTNNYQRSHPDSCSAPYHEFVGTFYKPEDGVGLRPSAGTNYPASTQRDD